MTKLKLVNVDGMWWLACEVNGRMIMIRPTRYRITDCVGVV